LFNCLFSLGHCVICPSIYRFWLPRWYLQTHLFYHILLSNLLTMNELGEGCYRSVPRALSYLHLYWHLLEDYEKKS
jgi:hypothetical protein